MASLLACAMATQAQVKLCPLFTDNMVMQQQTDAPIWGTCRPGKKVTLKTSWDKRTYTTTADSEGCWRTTVSTPSAGGPYTVTISEGKSVTLKNVMIGEVWLCSGQSNMDMPVKGWGKVKDYEAETSNANHENIRLLQVKQTVGRTPQENFKAMGDGWQVCSPQTIGQFSSTAYFFGRDLEKYRGVPVGLIQSSWGGTPVEAWTSAEGLESVPTMPEKARHLASYPTDKTASKQKFVSEKAEWESLVVSRNKAFSNGKPVYGTLSYDDSAWEAKPVPAFLHGDKYDTFDGMVWLRRVVTIPEDMAGKELTLCLGRIDDDDITFYNGVEIGRTEGATVEREYTIPSDMVKEGRAVILVRNFDTGGDAGISGYTNRPCELRSPDGKSVTLNGEWRVNVDEDINSLPPRPREPNSDPHNVSVLYNAMINPIVPYAIKGAIWYQGEENASRAWQYRDLLPALIEDWRTKWDNPFPFYIVQLANYMQRKPQPEESTWAELREAQQMTAQNLRNCGLACNIDIGEANDIHPKNKQEVGRRLALLARGLTYGEQVATSGPVYSHHVVEGGKIRLFFDQCDGGLATLDGEPLKGFAVAGADHQYHWADAVIEGNSVVVSSKEVKLPIAVRYAWADNPQCNLTNKAKLPAVPFRTDDWPGLTYNNTNY